MWNRLRILLCISLMCASLPVFAQNSVSAAADRNEVKTGEVFTYTIKVEGEFTSPQVKPPDFGKLKIVARRQSRNYRTHGGVRHVEAVFVYQLVAYQPGEYILDKVEVTDAGKVYSSNAVTVQVTGEPIDIEHEKELNRFRQGATSL